MTIYFPRSSNQNTFEDRQTDWLVREQIDYDKREWRVFSMFSDVLINKLNLNNKSN